MKTRTLVALALLPPFLLILLFCPPWMTAVLAAALSVVAVYELLETAGLARHHLRLQIYSAVAAVCVCVWCACGSPSVWGTLLLFVYFAALFGEMLAAHTSLLFPKICAAAFSGLVVPYFLSSLVRILMMANGRFYIIVALIMAFGSDTGAYFVGVAIGKRKLAPLISPKKTVEGFVGGILSSVVLMLIYAIIVRFVFRYDVSFVTAALYGILGSLAAVMGDLTFSVIKRQSGVKDYGTIMPGHGGVLDRFDSVIVAAPLAELLVAAIPMIGAHL